MSAIEVLRDRYPGGVTLPSGDAVASSAALVLRVRLDGKVASCGALRDFDDDEPLAAVGRRNILLAWDGSPEPVVAPSKREP